jgi:hypothetical protein
VFDWDSSRVYKPFSRPKHGEHLSQSPLIVVEESIVNLEDIEEIEIIEGDEEDHQDKGLF